jgi:hypothetical protein
LIGHIIFQVYPELRTRLIADSRVKPVSIDVIIPLAKKLREPGFPVVFITEEDGKSFVEIPPQVQSTDPDDPAFKATVKEHLAPVVLKIKVQAELTAVSVEIQCVPEVGAERQ